jgi:asparagine synthase (glutamine-hydrolysing)
VKAVSTERFVHPWLLSARNTPPGKLWHVASVALNAVDNPFARPDDPEIVNPFMSQPFAELCLRTPTYLHISGGRERALARMAFREDIPREVYERTTKGGLEEYAKDIVLKNIGFMREMLLDGVLVREKLIDRKAMEDALSCEPRRISLTTSSLLAYLSKEAWFHRWGQTKARAAA